MLYKEEQNKEIEALEAIYCEELKIKSTEPFHKFVIPIKSEGYEQTKNGYACNLIFTYTPKYPEEMPTIEINASENLTAVAETELYEYILEVAKENIGSVMIIKLISAGQEWLDIWEYIINKEREDNLECKLEEETSISKTKETENEDTKLTENGSDAITVHEDESLFQDFDRLLDLNYEEGDEKALI